MLLSSETLLGIRRTSWFALHVHVYHNIFFTAIYIVVKSYIEFVPFLLSLPEVKQHKLEFLSQNLCQDPLEIFFGCQRQRGGTSDNLSVAEFFANTSALHVVDSFCRDPVRGNCRGQSTSRDREHDVEREPGAHIMLSWYLVFNCLCVNQSGTCIMFLVSCV